MTNQAGNTSSDKYLVDKVLNGDTQAFAGIVKNTEKLVIQIISKMVANTADQKDIAQDVYLKAYRKLSGFQYGSKLSTWIAQISYNTCLDYLKKKKLVLLEAAYKGRETEEEESDLLDKINNKFCAVSGDAVVQKNLAFILKTEIDQLPPIYKTLITLYHNEEVGYEEIGQITGLPIGTVKSYLFRARKMLKENLLLHYKKEDL